MKLVQLVYASRPFGFDQSTLDGILTQSRRCNTRDGLTGALVCRGDIYLQLLEGNADALDATYARIVQDDRHLEITRLVYADATERLFPAWSMRSDPARTWMWSQDDVAKGVATQASPESVLGIFRRLAAEPVQPPKLTLV
ncbi:blue light sensor protein [Methylobacterium sp. Leaf111]|uniref:BLUF domain-containing protein n=1 Tax=Methylobacterium sp. Leaf111 TaxID=1736257 RepID=UPI0006FEF74B|nr:BLUF domain-containing protein [Methylobacterium sp. Leaf111]KQP69938.1 blue light sensor protein [Methylobacterium sp. Leaf111]